MTVGSIRSGLVEAEHPVSAIALGADGEVIATLGDDLDRDFFLRSAPKPLQATVANRFGADLHGEQLAVASSSHSGFPVHVAYVEQMLNDVGLDTSALLCPPARPSSADADRVWAREGRDQRERVFHNCSGKHAGMLRACVAQDWPLDYANPDHPLQREMVAAAEEVTGRPVEPVGVDGCGVPTLRSDVVGLARLFSALVNSSEFAEAAATAARFASLTADGTRAEVRLARWVPSVVKGGAAGCIGLGMLEHGLAFAAKCWTGESAPAGVALIALMEQVGAIPPYQLEQLAPVARPHVFGGGKPVGSLHLLDA